MAATMRPATAVPAIAALVFLVASAGVASAAPDPALCPFELGYNPVFNADGTVLSCTKGGPQPHHDSTRMISFDLEQALPVFQSAVIS